MENQNSKPSDVNSFIVAIEKGIITNLEIHKWIESLTDFNDKKLRLLSSDLEDYLEQLLLIFEQQNISESDDLFQNAQSDFERVIEYIRNLDQKDSNYTEHKNKNLSKSLLLDGQKLNLLERYLIANNVFNFDEVVRKMNIPDMEKYQFVSYILGCNKTNARHLMNNSYGAKAREELIKNYLEDLNM